MTDKFIRLLKDQIHQLEAADFDLEAWKSATIIYLSRIFGGESAKIEQIDKIRYEQGSWSLRDASGNSDLMISCKRRGRSILEACINELKVLGVAEGRIDPVEGNPVSEGLSEELKVSQLKELKKILKTKSSREEKSEMITNKLLGFGYEISPRIISHIMTHPKNKNLI